MFDGWDSSRFPDGGLYLTKVVERWYIANASFIKYPKKNFHERVRNSHPRQIVECVQQKYLQKNPMGQF